MVSLIKRYIKFIIQSTLSRFDSQRNDPRMIEAILTGLLIGIIVGLLPYMT